MKNYSKPSITPDSTVNELVFGHDTVTLWEYKAKDAFFDFVHSNESVFKRELGTEDAVEDGDEYWRYVEGPADEIIEELISRIKESCDEEVLGMGVNQFLGLMVLVVVRTLRMVRFLREKHSCNIDTDELKWIARGYLNTYLWMQCAHRAEVSFGSIKLPWSEDSFIPLLF